MALKQDLLDRLADKFTVGDECWEWTGCRNKKGYGTVWLNGRNVVAHRVIYELLSGPITSGLPLDHLCRNRGCVRPAHLEPATHKVNILRGFGAPAMNARKTHCLRGHAFTRSNTYVRPSRPGTRECLRCKRDRR